jgi:hypothetical protein
MWPQIASIRYFPDVPGSTSFDENGDTSVHLLSVYKVANREWTWADRIDYQGTLP